jgi:hypothetical protein
MENKRDMEGQNVRYELCGYSFNVVIFSEGYMRLCIDGYNK